MQNGTAGIAADRVEWEMDEAHGLALEARGLSVETAVRLGWRPCAGPSDDLWISIPYYDHGQRVGAKLRTLSGAKQFVQEKGTPQILWNVDALRDPHLTGYPVVITEGEMDALAAIQAGYLRTVSVPGGAPERDSGDGPYWHYLAHAQQLLKEQRAIVLAVDADHKGQVLRDGLARRLGRSRCQVLRYPDGSKDLNDILREHGERVLRHTLAQAEYVPLPGLLRLRDIPERAPKVALDTMIPGLEPHLRLRRGDLIVVTGPPGHGKSTFVANIACNMAWHWQTVTAMASMEQTIVPDLRRVLRSYRCEQLEKHMSEDDKAMADQWIDQHFVFLQGDEGEDMTLSWMLERFAAARQRFGATINVIDPWNEVSIIDKPGDWTTEQTVSQSLRVMKSFARTHDVVMIVVAHPAKMRRDKNGKVPKPGLWDIADSAAWANRCDLGVVVYRPDLQTSSTEISVEKSRDFYSIGKPGMVTLNWEPESSRFVQAW
jgi:twinkle protein